jgi:cytosine/adenosine deaminase-related metal-dependent hydrolase
MNWEAGKLLRTGLTPEQALSTVTNGSAKAVAIDARVGSLEAGKDGDFVIWSGNPLSQFTRAEQTWVDGRRYFSLEEDAAMREQIARERTQLIQAILSVGNAGENTRERRGSN